MSTTDHDIIPADKKPVAGWHWPTYWQVMAEQAKEVNGEVKLLFPAKQSGSRHGRRTERRHGPFLHHVPL